LAHEDVFAKITWLSETRGTQFLATYWPETILEKFAIADHREEAAA
jgi:hypothetical protein